MCVARLVVIEYTFIRPRTTRAAASTDKRGNKSNILRVENSTAGYTQLQGIPFCGRE